MCDRYLIRRRSSLSAVAIFYLMSESFRLAKIKFPKNITLRDQRSSAFVS